MEKKKKKKDARGSPKKEEMATTLRHSHQQCKEEKGAKRLRSVLDGEEEIVRALCLGPAGRQGCPAKACVPTEGSSGGGKSRSQDQIHGHKK